MDDEKRKKEKRLEFRQYLEVFLTDAQIEYMKESLLNHKGIHFYGEEGTGKSVLWEEFYRNGFTQVTEAGMLECIGMNPRRDQFGIPKYAHNVALIELYGMKKTHILPEERVRFSRQDIDEWLRA